MSDFREEYSAMPVVFTVKNAEGVMMRSTSFMVKVGTFLAGILMVTAPLSEAIAAWQEITGSIKTEIGAAQPPLGPHDVKIEYLGRGTILLSGSVAGEAERERIGAIAARTKGVKEVRNELTVASAGAREGDARSEVERVKRSLAQHVASGSYSISIESAPEGVVLRGTADNAETKEEIIRAARIATKRPIIQEIMERGLVDDASIKTAIEELVRSEYPRLLRDLDIAVANGVVTLKGNFPSRREVDKVLASILMVKGVRDIESDVLIGGRPYARGE